MRRNRGALIAAALFVLFILGMMQPVGADGITLTASPSTVTVAPGESGSTTVTVHIPVGGNPQISPVSVQCADLPAPASCSTIPNPLPFVLSDGDHFILTIHTVSSTPTGTYTVVVELMYILPEIIQSSFLGILPIGSGGIGTNSIAIQQSITVTVTITVIVAAAKQQVVRQVAVGGEILPVNLTFVLGPWIAAMLALGVVALDTLVVRRRKNLEA